MSDDGPLSQFFGGLDEFDGFAWEVRVTFPLPYPSFRLSALVEDVEDSLPGIALRTRSSLLGRTGPTSWAFAVSTRNVASVFFALEDLLAELFGRPVGAIDIVPRIADRSVMPLGGTV
jgi:hypothetical protein